MTTTFVKYMTYNRKFCRFCSILKWLPPSIGDLSGHLPSLSSWCMLLDWFQRSDRAGMAGMSQLCLRSQLDCHSVQPRSRICSRRHRKEPGFPCSVPSTRTDERNRTPFRLCAAAASSVQPHRGKRRNVRRRQAGKQAGRQADSRI